jgi:hypothetical protein
VSGELCCSRSASGVEEKRLLSSSWKIRMLASARSSRYRDRSSAPDAAARSSIALGPSARRSGIPRVTAT